MDRSTRVEVVGRLLCLSPSPSEVNDEFPSFQAGNFKERWPNTFRLDCTALGQPIGPVTRQNSWEAYLGRPMEQTVPGTCALVACTVCVEAVHRLEHTKHHHGEGTFPCKARAPYKLLIACLRDRTWTPGEGAYVGAVLDKMQQLGGAPATTTAATPAAPCLLPLRSWQKHSGAGLTPKRVAELIDIHGPCVGVLWVCPWYHHFDAGRDDELVYRGCGRSVYDRLRSKALYGDRAGSHAVVCFAYRFCGEQMHVLVLDNHGPTGPRRWVDVEELDTIYTLNVERLDPPLHLDDLSLDG
ncbi:hypothetical protein ACP70R_002844 [Stipagrostis hirtigluma subsp. patula]